MAEEWTQVKGKCLVRCIERSVSVETGSKECRRAIDAKERR